MTEARSSVPQHCKPREGAVKSKLQAPIPAYQLLLNSRRSSSYILYHFGAVVVSQKAFYFGKFYLLQNLLLETWGFPMSLIFDIN